MKTIQARVLVTDAGTVTVPVPADVTPGEWDVVLVLSAADEEAPARQPQRASFGQLQGLLREHGSVTAEEIDAAQFQFEWDGETLR